MKELYVKIGEQLEMIGTAKKYYYDNEVYFMVERYGMFPRCYNAEEINEFLKNFIVKEVI